MRLIALAVVVALSLVLDPLGADSQQTGKVYRVGVLSSASPPDPSDRAAGMVLLRNRLRELGYIESQNLIIEQRYAEGKLDRLPALARELVEVRADVIVAVGAAPTGAAKDATQTIPIVMAFVTDPVGQGFVKRLASPGGNITGVSYWAERGSEGKRLELLKEAIPLAARIAYLGVPGPVAEAHQAASSLGIKLVVAEVQGGAYDGAFVAMRNGRADAVLVQGNPTFNRDRKRIIALAARHRLPAIYEWRHHVEEGGLMAYGGNFSELQARVASYIDRIFKGAKPADLPIEQPKKYELVVNLNTARALGLTIPQSILLRTDQIIE